MVQILIFGDSIAWGAWDKEGGWVQRLRKFIDEKNLSDPEFYCLVYNLGVSGNTTEDLLERFEFETKQRMKEGEETVFIFAIGTNDSQFLFRKNGTKVSIEKFRKNIQKIIELAKKFSSKIIFLGLFPVDESRSVPLPWDSNKAYKNELIRRYNEVIKEVCDENNVPFIDTFEKISKLEYSSLLEDGLHPNSKGHEMIFEMVKKEVEKFL